MAYIAASSISTRPRFSLATTGASGLKLFSFMNIGRSSSLYFGSGRVPALFRISCAAKPETIDKVCGIVRKQLAIPIENPLTAESTFIELGADSLDTVEIVMGLEEEFGITVDEDNAQNITTVQDAADLIEELCSNKVV